MLTQDLAMRHINPPPKVPKLLLEAVGKLFRLEDSEDLQMADRESRQRGEKGQTVCAAQGSLGLIHVRRYKPLIDIFFLK